MFVKSKVLLSQRILLISAPKYKLGLIITFKKAVSVQPKLFFAINLYKPPLVTLVESATGKPPYVQTPLKFVRLYWLLMSTLIPGHTVSDLSGPNIGLVNMARFKIAVSAQPKLLDAIS